MENIFSWGEIKLNIAKDIYQVGGLETLNGLGCNPYILVDEQEVVFFDPGSQYDFETVLDNLKKLIDLNTIKYVVLHHQDPDLCSSVPMFENLGLNFQIVTSWRAKTLIQYYGIKSEYYLLEENEHQLKLASGRVLQFIPTPYLHFAGAFVTYDSKTRVLFSSDLFGAYSYNHTIYAEDDYLEKMLTFHEHYMPSNSVIRPVMDILSTYNISMILPQHGAIINKKIKMYIEALRTLECGTLLNPIKKNLLESGGYLRVLNDIVKRLLALYPKERVQNLMQSRPELHLSSEDSIDSYTGNPMDIWNRFFDSIREKEGLGWLTSIEPYVRKLVATYDINMPDAYESFIISVNMENQRLLEINQSLEQTINLVNERLIKDSVTGLYNEIFLKSILEEELNKEEWREIGAFISIGIDNFSNYKLFYGTEEVQIALNNLAYILKEQFGNHAVFKLDSTDFGIYLKGFTKEEMIQKMEEIRIRISKSELFLQKITVSIGIAFSDELKVDLPSFDLTVLDYMELSFTRLRKAKYSGKNCVCATGRDEVENMAKNKVLLIDPDRTNSEVLKTFLNTMGIDVYIAEDGFAAIEIIEKYSPDMIVTEINLPKLDGFLLREELMSNSATKQIQMIYLSYQKDEDSVIRAQELGVIHYVKKPYLLSELLGLIKFNLSGV